MRVFLEEFTRRLPHIRLVPNQKFDFLSNTSFRGPASCGWNGSHCATPSVRDKGVLERQLSFKIGAPVKDDIARTVVVSERYVDGENIVRLVLNDPRGRTLPAWTGRGACGFDRWSLPA